METLLGSPLLLLIISLISGITLLILYFKHIYCHWERHNIPYVPAQIPFGNLKEFIQRKKSSGEIIANIYHKLKSTGKPFFGTYIFWNPQLVAIDPEMIKLIMSKEFQHFSARTIVADIKHEPLTGHLLNLNGDEWKFMRSKLTPTFTSGKMKSMFQTIASCSEYLQVVLDEHCATGKPVDVKDTMGRFTTDIIGSCAFGIDCNSLKEPDNVFRKQGKKLFEMSTKDMFQTLFINSFPKIAYALGIKRIPKGSSEFFLNLVAETVSYREKNNVSRKDFIDLLMQLKKDGDIKGHENESMLESGKLTLEQIAAQSFVFFLAGFETSSTTLSSIMYELSTHQDVQDKLRQEINEVLAKNNNVLTYDLVMEMKYLEQVIDETMRLHAVASLLGRTCTQDYTFPNGYTIKKGMIVFIPIKGLHEDPEYYPNPKQFNPDRFSREEKAKRNPYVFLPFGAGPRNCIGLRFGMLQMKVGLIAFLQNYKFKLNPKTQLPLRQNPRNGLLNYIGGIWVDAEKI